MFDTAVVATATQALVDAMEAASGLTDPARVDAIRGLEELVCVATAAQAALAIELDASQRAEQAAAGVPAERQGRGVAAQVALARRESHHRGQQHLGLAKIAASELPCTWRAWRQGRVTEWKATLVARETAFLSREDRAAVDVGVAGDPVRLARMGDRELAAACRQEAYRLDPAGYVERRRRAEAERHVSLRPAPDTMTWLGALVPVKDGVAVKAALSRAADTARAAGDPRTRGQVEADTLVDSVLGAAAARERDQAIWDRPTDSESQAVRSQAVRSQAVPSQAGGPGLTLGLVMSDASLFGTSEEPGHVEGYGPIPAELAREIVAGMCSREERVWLRRLYASPDTGELVAADARGRCFPGSLGRFIALRDRVCRTPWCDAPIRHHDHAEAHGDGGPTSLANGQGLCEACNHAKQAPGWRARPSPTSGGHRVETTTPTGHIHDSTPPVLVTIRESWLRLDYVLAG